MHGLGQAVQLKSRVESAHQCDRGQAVGRLNRAPALGAADVSLAGKGARPAAAAAGGQPGAHPRAGLTCIIKSRLCACR